MTDPAFLTDAKRIIQQLRNDNNDAAADLIEALREQCALESARVDWLLANNQGAYKLEWIGCRSDIDAAIAQRSPSSSSGSAG